MVRLEEFIINLCVGWAALQPASIFYVALTVFFVIINTALSMSGTFANIIIILSYYRYNNVRAVQNTLFTALAVTDLTITAIAQPMYIVATMQSAFYIYDCKLWFVIHVTSSLCLGLSLVTVTILSGHSYVTLAYPYHYQRLAPSLKGVTTVSWLFVIAVIALQALFASAQVFIMTGACLIIFTILAVTCTWLWTYKLIRRHRRRIATSQTPTNFPGNLAAQKKVLRSTTTACMVVGGLVTCYLPGFARLVYEANVSGNNWVILEYVLRPIGTTLMYGNSLLNPCLVLWRSTEFRQAAKQILNC